MRRTLVLLLAIVALLAAACGDDSSTNTTAEPDDNETPDPGTNADGTSAAAACPAQGFDGSVSRSADGDPADGGHADATFGTADVWSDGVVAARLTDGGQYTLYVSDHEYVGDPTDFDTIVAASGGTLATVFVGMESGYVAGETVADTDEGAFISVIIDSGGGASANTLGSVATATPIAWDEDWVCLSIDYTDDLQSVSGTISAPIVAGF